MNKENDRNKQNKVFQSEVSTVFLQRLNEYLAEHSKITEKHSFGEKDDPLKKQFEAYMDENETAPFNEYLLDLIAKKGMKNSEAYKASGVSKFTFSKIKNDRDYRTSKETVASFAIGLRLSIPEAEELYLAAGHKLTTSEMPDLIIRFFIENGIYDLAEVDYCLSYYGFPLIGTAAFEFGDEKE